MFIRFRFSVWRDSTIQGLADITIGPCFLNPDPTIP